MDDHRKISLELFQEVRPTCIAISNLCSSPSADAEEDTTRISSLLQTLRNILDQNQKEHGSKNYALAGKLADYLFFPISNLLKKESLDSNCIRHILYIIGFLLKFSWVHEINDNLIDQLSPVIIYLCQKLQISRNGEILKEQDILFCLTNLVHCFPQAHFQSGNKKRLSILGDITTILLDILSSISQPLDQEKNQLVEGILITLSWLYEARVTAEQGSHVLPGIVSKVVSSTVKSKNLQVNTLMSIFGLLKTMICKVFSDSSLDAQLTAGFLSVDSIGSLKKFYDDKGVNNELFLNANQAITDILINETGHRTKSWLAATSKQLKIALLSLFKYVFFNTSVQSKVKSNLKLQEAIFEFMNDVTELCSMSLFNDIILLFSDILSLLLNCICESNSVDFEELYRKGSDTLIKGDSKYLTQLHVRLFGKLDDLIMNHLDQVFLMSNHEKLNGVLTAIQFHFVTLEKITEVLHLQIDSISSLKQEVISKLSKGMISLLNFSKRGTTKITTSMLSELGGDEELSRNTLDDVVLPSYINARSIAKKTNSQQIISSLKVTDQWSISSRYFDEAKEEIYFFDRVLPHSVERRIHSFCKFIGESTLNSAPIVESLLGVDSSEESEQEGGIPLWIANVILRSTSSIDKNAEIDDFIDFGEETGPEKVNSDDDSAFVVLDYAERIFESSPQHSRSDDERVGSSFNLDELNNAVALQSIEVLCQILSKEDFQSYVMMDHAYHLLEAITQGPETTVHKQARMMLHKISHAYYDGSVIELVRQNSDYLIDSVSLNLSVSSGLTPSLPAILLVILKIAGQELVRSNQLRDIIGEIFLVIDSFHGYSILIENLFTVLAEVVSLIKHMYLSELTDHNKLHSGPPKSRFEPWGMQTRDQFLSLVDKKIEESDPFANYDPQKKYFLKNPGTPFEEDKSDSDDDSDDEDLEAELVPTEEGTSHVLPIPEDSYLLVLQIFKYGLQLLTHPSIKLRKIILQTLKNAYIIVASDYERLMPVLADFWPIIMSLISGTNSVAEWGCDASEQQQLIEPALQLTTCVFEEDAKHGSFMSRRFLETWDYISKRLAFFKDAPQNKDTLSVSPFSATHSIREAYTKLLVTALNNYERQIPHQTALSIIRACVRFGLKNSQLHLNRDLQVALWVVNNYGEVH